MLLYNENQRLVDRTTERGLTAKNVGARLPVWLDYDHDKRLDFVMTQFGGDARLYHQNANGTFTDLTSTAELACTKFHDAELFDANNDGQLDAVVSILDDAPVILRNAGTPHHWIGIELSGTKSNRNGIGARVTVTDVAGKKRIFDAGTAGSYLSSNDPRIVVGLGNVKAVRNIEVRWPSGRVQTITGPAIDRYLRTTEP